MKRRHLWRCQVSDRQFEELPRPDSYATTIEVTQHRTDFLISEELIKADGGELVRRAAIAAHGWKIQADHGTKLGREFGAPAVSFGELNEAQQCRLVSVTSTTARTA